MKKNCLIIGALIFVIINTNLKAQPDFSSKQTINNILIYSDVFEEYIYYYAPYGIKLMTDTDGKPDFAFVLMRYTGTHAYGDQGTKRFRSLLRFSVVNESPSKEEIENIKQHLLLTGKSNAELKPLPIHQLNAYLVYATTSDADNDSVNLQTISNGFFEDTNNGGQTGSYWKERDFTVRLDNESAQLFWDAFNGKKSILSVGYSFAVKGVRPSSEEITIEGNSIRKDKFKDLFALAKDSTENELISNIILAGAVDVYIDSEKWPDLAKRVDLNERIPPGYPAVDVYCFDFNNEIRDDLYAKRIEVKAEGVGRNDASVQVTFRSSQPDLYAHTIHFAYAVNLDSPLKYRITEIFNDGKIKRGEWLEKDSWHEILDITSKIEE